MNDKEIEFVVGLVMSVGGWKNDDIGERGFCGSEGYGMIMENREMWEFL